MANADYLCALRVCIAPGFFVREKLERVLTCDPGTGVVRHADAGYPDAIATADRHGIPIPMRMAGRPGDA